MSSIEERVIAIVRHHMQRPLPNGTKLTLKTEVNPLIDHITMIGVQIKLEKEFDITFDSQFAEINTVEDLLNKVTEALSAKV